MNFNLRLSAINVRRRERDGTAAKPPRRARTVAAAKPQKKGRRK